MPKRIKIEYVKNLFPIFTKPKRIKIIVGGRGSTKSTGVADYVAAKLTTGQLWCCARENQNSIEESVHRTILDEIGRLEIEGFEDTKNSITHIPTGGRTFYRGLARNITSLKSTLSGIDGLWIEEGDLSQNVVLASGDMVYVPRNGWGNVNLVNKRIRPLFELIIWPARIVVDYYNASDIISTGSTDN